MAEAGAWMPMYWADYLADTMHLTTEQHGAYMLLIAAYWRRGGPLPADDQYLKQVTRAGKRWGHIKPAVMEFFTLEPVSDDQNRASDNRVTVATEKSKTGLQIRHKRLEKEILRSSNRLESARAAGKAGGLAKSKLTTTTVTIEDTSPNGEDADASPDDVIFYREGKTLLGDKSGGQLTKLRRACDDDCGRALTIVRLAAEKQNPAEYIAGVIRNRGSPPPEHDYAAIRAEIEAGR